MRAKTALVLGGGGTRGALQVGFIRRIAELRIPVDFVVGTSAGALNAAFVAFHEAVEHDCLAEIWRGLRGRRLYGRNPFAWVRGLARRQMGLYDNAPLRRLLEEHLRADDFSAARIPLHVTATNLCTGEREVFHRGPLIPALLASAALPGIFPPVRIGRDLFADGGIVAGLDIAAAVELGASTVIAIDLHAASAPGCPRNVVEVLWRSLEILVDARSTCSTEHAGYGGAAVVHVQPQIPAADAGAFSDVDRLLEEGYRAACAVFERCWDGARLIPGHYHGVEAPPRERVGS